MNEPSNYKELAVQAFNELKKIGGFDISICDNIPNIDDNPKFRKLAITNGQKMQMSTLVGSLPSVMAVNQMTTAANSAAVAAANAPKLFAVAMPNGVTETLMRVNATGNWTNVVRSSDGFVRYAPMSPFDISKAAAVNPTAMATQAAVMGTFAAMSVVTNQYYLAKINSELTGIKKGMDDILAFLYGDKKAELMSEISFAKYAYENYAAIMAHSDQKAATIASLQEGKKVAMKDTEFYISDIASTMQENSGIETVVEKACQINKSLDLAMQLSVMSAVLEVYYAQNFDKEYLDYIDRELSLYIDKCDKFRLAAFSKLHERVENFKSLPTKKINKEELIEKINDVLEPLQNGNESPLRRTLREGLYSSSRKSTYYLSSNGDVYIKEA